MYSRAADTRSEDQPARQAPPYGPPERADERQDTAAPRASFAPARKKKALGAENNRPSLVTTDRYKYAGYDAPTEPKMSPEFPVMSRKSWQGPSMEDRKIFGAAATHRTVE